MRYLSIITTLAITIVQSIATVDAQVTDAIAVSGSGSIRATAYAESNKMITNRSRTFLVWLDAPLSADPTKSHRAQLAVYDHNKKSLSTVQTLFGGPAAIKTVPNLMLDDHGSPTLVVDSQGYFHVLLTSSHKVSRRHASGIIHFKSNKPWSFETWSKPQVVFASDKPAYTSCVVDSHDTIHMLYRASNTEPFSLHYATRAKTGEWRRKSIAHFSRLRVSGERPTYASFSGSVAIDKHDYLHVTYSLHHEESKKRLQHSGIAYLISKDCGETWTTALGQPIQLPMSLLDSPAFIKSGSGTTELRSSSVSVDLAGIPSVVVHSRNEEGLSNKAGKAIEYRFENKKWKQTNILDTIRGKTKLDIAAIDYDFPSTTTYDSDNAFHCAMTLVLAEKERAVARVVRANSGTWAVKLIERDGDLDSEKQVWLPNIERTIDARPIKNPCILYTNGHYSGDTNQTKVRLSNR